VAAEFRKPVMLYSIGKDSSVLLDLAMKAFHPAKPPFPLLHIDTTWKFREMIAFRDRRARELGLELLVHDDRMPLLSGEVPQLRSIRFRTLGCYRLTGATPSSAADLPAIVREMMASKTSERQSRIIDRDSSASMERKKVEGYL
jgi:3'-phosphoadenosine 5'-phosphosulfate sulfotransferase (PAPS reductase)/FAD synthetase